MQILNKAIPYAQRCIRTDSGTVVVWPFLNAERGGGPFELFLDTNALSKSNWFVQLPEEIRKKCVINPWPAMVEQWISNPDFRKSPADRIGSMTENLVKNGAQFRKNYAEEQERILKKYDEAFRTQFTIIVPYVAMMKSLLGQKIAAEDALQRLEEILQEDIPRFTSAIMLTALAVLLKGNQSVRLVDDPKPAFSYLSSFLDFQPGKKDETDYMNVSYLRNRAGDLNLWLTLPMLRQQGYQFVGAPAIVSGDRALHRLIVRVIPPVLQENPAMALTLHEEGLPKALCEKIIAIGKKVQIRPGFAEDVQLTRMKNLFELAKQCCVDEREKEALDQMFSEWWLPGFGKEFRMS